MGWSEENEKQYGYIYLSDLQANYRYTNFTYNVCKVISEALISILSEYEDHSARALLRPIDGEDDIMEGIYAAMSKADKEKIWKDAHKRLYKMYIEQIVLYFFYFIFD